MPTCKLFDDTRPLYLETKASGVGFEVMLVQITDEMTSTQDETLHNSMLRLIAFTSKILSSAEERYGNMH